MHPRARVITTVIALVAAGAVLLGSAASDEFVSSEARSAAIRRAQVWTRTDIKSMNLREGPQGPGAFAANQTVACDYVGKPLGGRSPKFRCALTPGEDVKVRYGRENGELFGEVAASRLLWALGFGADRNYSVRVACRGCSSDPWGHPSVPGDLTVFDPTSIQRWGPARWTMAATALETRPDSGWAWPELDLVDTTAGGAPRAQRDALKLLAVMIQQTDSKPSNQILLCVDDPPGRDGRPCSRPFMMIADLGLTFGHATRLNRNAVSSVNYDEWSRASVWDGPRRCTGNLAKSETGTLDHPLISEAGRRFLADLLVQLSDAQLLDLFEGARFSERRSPSIRGATIEQWVDAFKRKRDEIVSHTCSS
jgi:hypothetical protein